MSQGERERAREKEKKKADAELEFSSMFHLLILTCASSWGLSSPLCIQAPTFWLSSHYLGRCSLLSLPGQVSKPTNFQTQVVCLESEGGCIHFCWFHISTEDLGPPHFFLVIFNYCSPSSVTGWPTTSALAWVTQRSAGCFIDFVSSFSYYFFLLSLLLQKFTSHCFLTTTLHITLHKNISSQSF